jgi:hypothetical protein
MDLDIMEQLLNAAEDEAMPSVEDLDSLIYQDQTEEPVINPGLDVPGMEHVPEGLHSDGDVEVLISESRANIRIRVNGEVKQSISMGRIADIAIGAIMNELNGDAA